MTKSKHKRIQDISKGLHQSSEYLVLFRKNGKLIVSAEGKSKDIYIITFEWLADFFDPEIKANPDQKEKILKDFKTHVLKIEENG